MKSLITIVTVSVVAMYFLGAAPTLEAAPQLDDPAQQDLTPMASECSPKALKRYCAFKSKCKAEAKPMSWRCLKGTTFVVRIPKKAKFAIKKCRSIRAKIRKACEPRS